MDGDLLRRAWPSIRWGIALGCGAAFAGSWAFTLLLLSLGAIADLMRGVPFDVATYFLPWQFILLGVVLCFIVSAVPGSLGGAAIGLALHILGPGSSSLPKLGVRVGCFAGGLAGVVSALVAWLAPFGFVMEMMVARFGFVGGLSAFISVIGIAILAGGVVGRWLASHESARIADHANGDSRDQA